MNILNKAMKAMKKNNHLSVIKENKSHRDQSAGSLKNKFSEKQSNQAVKLSDKEQGTESEESVSIYNNHSADVEAIDIHKLDFNFSDLADDSVATGDSIFSINPVNPFSNHIDLDLNKLNVGGYITPTHANTLLSNTFRMIKRPVLNNALGKGASKVDRANLVMITSSLPSEGKTFSAINLAISIALEKDKHVLLIDADVNKPSHHKIFGVGENRGLTDVLSSRVTDMSEVLYRTNIPSLTLMSAGHEYAHATELLASKAMERFVNEISIRYADRVIIFDSPPLLMTTEASVLASHMGQVIVVIEAEKTLSMDIKRSISLLQNEIVLLVLNKMRGKNELGYYGYYGYGHSS